jgi:hypothetical protein
MNRLTGWTGGSGGHAIAFASLGRRVRDGARGYVFNRLTAVRLIAAGVATDLAGKGGAR